MKIGVGLKRAEQIYNVDYLRFLRQVGVTHIVGYKCEADQIPSSKYGYWSQEDLSAMCKHYKDNGLVLEGIENLPVHHWMKVLHDLPGREKQMDNIKYTIQNMGKTGIPVLGYNFSLTGCPERYDAFVGRAGVSSTEYDAEKHPQLYDRLPRRLTWNTVVDPDAEGYFDPVSRGEMKDRLYRFLDEVVPVAVESGVVLAAHPEDPPIPYIYSMGRVLITPEDFDEMLERYPTKYCSIEFCQGTFTEMGVDIYDVIRRYATADRIGYVHLRNVRGCLPKYHEVMIDDGDVDIARALTCYYESGYTGAFIPDHYPELAYQPNNDASLAYTVGYMRAVMKTLGIPIYGTDYED